MSKYNSSINVMGSIPNYASMIEYMIEEYTGVPSEYKSFQFRTAKSLGRFIKAINDAVLVFKSKQHKQFFYDSLVDNAFSENDKLLMIYWQMLYGNQLFYDITAEVFMKAVYQGKSSLSTNDIYSYVRYLKKENAEELNWSETTLKIIGSKYLTALKKLGLATGNQRKEIKYPVIGDALFVYFIRWCQLVCPNEKTLKNPFIKFAFLDEMILINRLKKIEFIPYWDITQMGNEVTIDLKSL